MSALVDTDSDVEIIESLEFDPDLACERADEAGNAVCSQPAAWVWRCKVCSYSFLLCEEHTQLLIRETATFIAVVCGQCNRTSWFTGYQGLFDVLPIGGA